MFDLDAGKLLIIGIVALVVIPPKDLPSVMRQVGQAVGKLRRMAAEFQSQFMQAIHEAELDEIRKDVAKFTDAAKLPVNFDPVATVRNEIKGALGEIPAAAPPQSAPFKAADAAVSTDSQPPQTPTENAAAAGIAPLAPEHPSEAAAADVSHAAAETAVAQAPAEPAGAAPEADARRS